MKKFRILALIMTCAILLSSIMIVPVVADEGNGNAPQQITVDFSQFAKLDCAYNEKTNFVVNGSTVTVENNGADSNIGDDCTRAFWGGVIDGLTIDNTTQYTLVYKVNCSAPTEANAAIGVGGLFVDGVFEITTGTESAPMVNYIGQYTNHNMQARLTRAESKFEDNRTFSNDDFDKTDGFVTTKLVYNFATNRVSNYYLKTNGTWMKVSDVYMGLTDATSAKIGFLLYVYRPFTTDGTVIKDVELYKETVSVPNAENVWGRTITVDGSMSPEEGWSTTPQLQTTYFKKIAANPFAASEYQVDNEPSELYISTDGEMIYFFYRTTHDDTLTHSNALISFYFVPDGMSQADAVTAGKDTFYLGIKPQAEGMLVDFGTKLNDKAYKSDYTDGDPDNGEIEIVKNTTENTLSFELAFKISDALAEELQEGTVDYRVSVRELSRTYNEEDASGAGYVFSASQPCDMSAVFQKGHGDIFTLPQIGKTAPVLVGFQSREGKVAGTYDVRFVSVVDKYEGFAENASKLGYLFGYGDKEVSKDCTKIYETLNYTKADGSTGVLNPEDYGGDYFFCFTITGLSKEAADGYTFDVKCFTQADAKAPVEYCVNPVTVTVKWNDTESKANFTY